MSDNFDSLNPYGSLIVIKDEEPEVALEKLKSIKTPVKIFFMGSHRNKFVIIVGDDIRVNDKKRVLNNTKGK